MVKIMGRVVQKKKPLIYSHTSTKTNEKRAGRQRQEQISTKTLKALLPHAPAHWVQKVHEVISGMLPVLKCERLVAMIKSQQYDHTCLQQQCAATCGWQPWHPQGQPNTHWGLHAASGLGQSGLPHFLLTRAV
jgi:hypothetical protein